MLFAFFVCGNNVFAQTREIKGIVSDKYGPVAGAGVVLKSNPTKGTTTDIDGKFIINATPEETLIFSFVGCADQEILVGDQQFIQVTLKESTAEFCRLFLRYPISSKLFYYLPAREFFL